MQNTSHPHPNGTGVAATAAFVLLLALGFFLVFGRSPEQPAPADVSVSGKWTCSMDPQFVFSEPGKCPKCFMDLIPLDTSAGGSGPELLMSAEAMQTAGITLDIAEPERNGAPEVSVPESALLWNLGDAYVYVESFDGEYSAFSLRKVEAGPAAGGRRTVSGLEAGESVAVSGLFRLDSAMQILGKPSLVNPHAGEVTMATEGGPGSYRPAERSPLDPRRENGLALDEWFAFYEGIRAALAQDDFAAAAAPSLQLAENTLSAAAGMKTLEATASDEAVTAASELSSLLASLSRISAESAQAEALGQRRAAFNQLSADMVSLARRYGSPPGGLNLVFCPMAFEGQGAHWLQPGETVDNPYHGLEMSRCGWIVEKIEE